ncbi:hypothetical protein SAMN05661080_00209 [Modestobacter sp. DSM 44400]|uniref:type II toxin-antitoxin system VapC family toxin n=1 Tax=Modestobacter sp. DSM 44400 TaxID=1550230 RepID=UPI0008948AC0|nr:type II toxin-antitoxin system VapC family toxin [Modestobacter sp. DSM 44400]SDX50182.1 hypothetical protein SAMN05661080_00209 [Modestobacter sp. DSM 44400]
MIVLDTNVVSEIVHPRGSRRVIQWFDAQALPDLHLTAVTVAELGYGVARLPDGRRRNDLARRLRIMVDELFVGRVLPFDQAAAEGYGPLLATRDRLGRPIGPADAQIAAIGTRHGAVLATRNIRDFEGLGLIVVDPWEV